MAYGKYANIQKERVVELKGLKLYIERLELSLGEDIVVITKNEAHILELLMERHPRVSGREDLLEALWDDQSFVDEKIGRASCRERVWMSVGEVWVKKAR